MKSREKQSVRIVIDDRERKSRVPDLLKSYSDIRVEIKRLTYGDYLMNGCLLIERKTVSDFSLSVTSGRLFQQAARMCRFPYWRMLILEGDRNQNHGLSPKAMQGAILALNLKFGLPVLRSSDERETATLIIGSIKHIRIPYDGNCVFIRPCVKTGLRKDHGPVEMLRQVPGIGRGKARILMNHFGSIQALVNADKDRLCQLPGIGVGTAETIFRMVRKSDC